MSKINLSSIVMNSFAAGFGLGISLFTGGLMLVALAALNVALAVYGIKQLKKVNP